jgi:hypothetical protein
MRATNTITSAVALALFFVACAKSGSESPEADVAPAAGAYEEDDILPEGDDANLPSQEEAAAQAAREIDETNADEELEKLKRELNGGD